MLGSFVFRSSLGNLTKVSLGGLVRRHSRMAAAVGIVIGLTACLKIYPSGVIATSYKKTKDFGGKTFRLIQGIDSLVMAIASKTKVVWGILSAKKQNCTLMKSGGPSPISLGEQKQPASMYEGCVRPMRAAIQKKDLQAIQCLLEDEKWLSALIAGKDRFKGQCPSTFLLNELIGSCLLDRSVLLKILSHPSSSDSTSCIIGLFLGQSLFQAIERNDQEIVGVILKCKDFCEKLFKDSSCAYCTRNPSFYFSEGLSRAIDKNYVSIIKWFISPECYSLGYLSESEISRATSKIAGV